MLVGNSRTRVRWTMSLLALAAPATVLLASPEAHAAPADADAGGPEVETNPQGMTIPPNPTSGFQTPLTPASPAPVGAPPPLQPGEGTAPSPQAGSSPPATVLPPATKPTATRSADEELALLKKRYEPLRTRGWTVDYPLPNNTLTGDNAFRRWLADRHVGYYLYSAVSSLAVNMLDVNRLGPNNTQLYTGQKATTRFTPQLIVNVDLSWLGLENAQFSASLLNVQTSWDPAGPNYFGLSSITYYQSFFKKLFELKVGYMVNALEFYGPYVGGNLASSLFGQSSSVISAMGISFVPAPRPGANLQVNLGHYYSKTGIQYSSSPDGYGVQTDLNPWGVKWTTPNAHALLIEEAGFKRAATRTERQSWARFGYLRNWSDYTDLQFGGRSTKNYAFYAMADHQLVKFSGMPSEAAGVYTGFSAHIGLDRYSRIAQTFEGRLYTQGPIKSRPADMASMIVDYNVFSVYAVDAARRAGQNGVTGSWQATWVYNVGVMPGLTWGLGLSYSDHPAPVVEPPGTGHAFSLLTNATWFL